ncbi:MAG: hypothetical protein ACREA9_10520 [Pyrinomonadaceae bacterium]
MTVEEQRKARIKAFKTVADLGRQATIDMAVAGVRQGHLTRKETAENLGVHPLTISRWIAAQIIEEPTNEPATEVLSDLERPDSSG